MDLLIFYIVRGFFSDPDPYKRICCENYEDCSRGLRWKEFKYPSHSIMTTKYNEVGDWLPSFALSPSLSSLVWVKVLTFGGEEVLRIREAK